MEALEPEGEREAAMAEVREKDRQIRNMQLCGSTLQMGQSLEFEEDHKKIRNKEQIKYRGK